MSIASMLSPAKLNLGLKVAFRYENGYHHIITLSIPIDLYDTIEISETKAGFHLNCKYDLPAFCAQKLAPYFEGDKVKDNLIYKSYYWFLEWIRDRYKILSIDLVSAEKYLKNIKVNIHKKIPSPYGLGGASSNAATLFKILLKRIMPFSKVKEAEWIKHLKKDVLSLGADISSFLEGNSSLISGIGEVHKIIQLPKLYGILGIPEYGFPTRLIYQNTNSSLQGRIKYKSILNSHLRQFNNFIEFLHNRKTNKESIVCRTKNLSSIMKFQQDISSSFGHSDQMNIIYLQNDLLKSCLRIFPEETCKLKEISKEASSIVSSALSNEYVFYSMSGAGSSFYVLTYKEIPQDCIHKIKKEYPMMHWFTFSNLNCE